MIIKAQVSWQIASSFPRDAVTINPHFEKGIGVITSTDAQSMADDLCTAMRTYGGGNKETRVKLYDAQASAPSFPLAEAAQGVGQNPEGGAPAETALCLSYFSGQNVPRRRGRLYVPFVVLGSVAAWRPSALHMEKVGSLASILANLGGADINWVVFSRVDNDARPVSNWYVDDEWDHILSRGQRATTRIVGTVDEE